MHVADAPSCTRPTDQIKVLAWLGQILWTLHTTTLTMRVFIDHQPMHNLFDNEKFRKTTYSTAICSEVTFSELLDSVIGHRTKHRT